jgi:multidrug efflux pump subunit AcrA (membrane-fusion protein)
VFMEVPEMDSSRVDVGDAAMVTVQALGGRLIEAPVARTSWSLDATNRSLLAEIDVANEGSLLRPGMYAMGTIRLERRENVLVLPVTAIVRVGSETFCCCVRNGKIERRKVALGLRSGSEVEVTSGVDEHSLVVWSQAEALSPGQPVELLHAAQ